MPNWIIRAETTVMYEKVIEATSEADAWERVEPYLSATLTVLASMTMLFTM